METFSAVLALRAGNSPVTGEFPNQRPVTRSFDVFFDLRLNKRLSKQSWGWWFETPSRPLWSHCNWASLGWYERTTRHYHAREQHLGRNYRYLKYTCSNYYMVAKVTTYFSGKCYMSSTRQIEIMIAFEYIGEIVWCGKNHKPNKNGCVHLSEMWIPFMCVSSMAHFYLKVMRLSILFFRWFI